MNKKILVLFNATEPVTPHEDYTDELKLKDRQTEADIIKALKGLGFETDILGIYDNIDMVSQKIRSFEPHYIFNLVERFKNNSAFDHHIASFLELQGVPYTGCGSLGLAISKDKGLSKKILSFHRIHVPAFCVLRLKKPIHRPKRMDFPILVKPLKEEASYGIAQASFVENDSQFEERVRFVQEQMDEDVIAEEYIEGREFYVSVIGNRRLTTFPLRELKFREVPSDEPKIASFKAKWDEEYRKRWGIKNEFADPLANGLPEKITHLSKKIYRLLSLQGYARLDLRVTPAGEIVFIEANPNPILAKEEDFAESALKSGCPYPQLIEKILRLAE